MFKLMYFDKPACLAQSPQLYKQMSVMGDFSRVFEIAPVFRAENSFSHRHATEFVGLDLEMAIKEHYMEVLDLVGELFGYLFKMLESSHQPELRAIAEQFPCPPFLCRLPVVKLTFLQGAEMLRQAGLEIDLHADLSTEAERRLGALVREQHGTDFYILHQYPVGARPFYTMLSPEQPGYTNSYDIFMRGEEICSGAQRIHDPEMLRQRAGECGLAVETLAAYIDAFRYGAFPHGGAGFGLERIVMLYCGLGNIRNSALFPRDPVRLTP